MTKADVIIIGGGVAGITLAAALQDAARVVLLERERQLGYHASGRSAAIYIRNYGGSAFVRRLNDLALPKLQCTPWGDEGLLSARGQLMVATPDEMPIYHTYLEGAVGSEEITPKEAKAMVPILREERLQAALYEPGAAEIDVDRLMQGAARDFRAKGGVIVSGAPVHTLRRDGNNWHVSTSSTNYEAPIIVNAAGAWADEIAVKAGLPGLGITPYRRSAAIIALPETLDPRPWPLFAAISESFYAKPDAGRLMVSPAEEEKVEPHDAFADDMALAEGLWRFEQAVTIEVTRVLSNWAGLRSFAPDRLPVVGFDPRTEGLFWLAGQGGFGVQTALPLAQIAASAILKQPGPIEAAALSDISPARLTKETPT